jgi:ribonucleotide monophosphatase NagD (HAD superfamily)
MQITRFGKPFPVAYRYAERMLVHEARGIGALPRDPAPHEDHSKHPYPLRRIYMIGDNPASDIAGANAAGEPWVSILVRTGVFQDDPGHHPAKHVVDDVAAALRLILELEGRPLL